MRRTLVEKLAEAHLAEGPRKRPVRAGDFVTIRPRHVLTHDNTASVIAKFHALGGRRVHDPSQPVIVLDHDVQNRSEQNLASYGAIERFAREQTIDFYPAGSGIGHQIMVDDQYVVPGGFVVAADSHANMYGALAAVGTPVVRTDAAAIWATGSFWWQVPPTVRVVLTGRLRGGATAKDLILTLCALYGSGEVLNAAVEISGPGLAALSIEDRLAIANMTTEWGALVGWFAPDARTFDFLRERRRILARRGVRRVSSELIDRWIVDPILPDADAAYAARIELDLASVTPQISGPDRVNVATPLAEMPATPIDKAYLVSCVNSRVEDFAAAAEVLRGKRVAPGVELYVAAASAEIEREATRRGDWQVLLDAGARPLPSGCGPCIGLGAGLLEPGEVGISASNRNFKGRMGSRDATCYLASPAVVAASAVAGRICGPPGQPTPRPAKRYEALEAERPGRPRAEVLAGFPERMVGRPLLLPTDDLDTDGIIDSDWIYRPDPKREELAAALFANYDPRFVERVRAGDIVVAGRNFGTGSSREQAVTAIQASSIPLIVADSFAATFLRNAFNNGLPCVTCPPLVEHLLRRFADPIAAGARTIVADEELVVDFVSATIRTGARSFAFPPLDSLAQSLVAGGGIEPELRRRLGEGDP